MTEKDEPTWPATAFMEQLQSMGESATEGQMDMFRRWMEMSSSTEGQMDMFRRWMEMSSSGQLPEFMRSGMGMSSAVFKTRVQSGGRISIPDAERDVLDIEEGDIVQAFIVPIKRGADNE